MNCIYLNVLKGGIVHWVQNCIKKKNKRPKTLNKLTHQILFSIYTHKCCVRQKFTSILCYDGNNLFLLNYTNLHHLHSEFPWIVVCFFGFFFLLPKAVVFKCVQLLLWAWLIAWMEGKRRFLFLCSLLEMSFRLLIISVFLGMPLTLNLCLWLVYVGDLFSQYFNLLFFLLQSLFKTDVLNLFEALKSILFTVANCLFMWITWFFILSRFKII